MRRGYGDEAMYSRVRELVARLHTLAAATDRASIQDLIRKALERHPGSPSLEAALAGLYSIVGLTSADALEVYAKAAESDRRNHDLLCLLARGEYQRERYDDAFRWARQALEADARDPETIGVLIASSEHLGSLSAALEFLHSLSLDAVGALSAYEAVAAKAPSLRDRVQTLYHEKLNQVDGNLRERALVEAYIAIGENRFRDAEALLKSAAAGDGSKSISGVLVGAYRRILESDPNAPGETALELARLYGTAGDVSAAARLSDEVTTRPPSGA
jgi:tetratricopeptide (TPR) repeat protein